MPTAVASRIDAAIAAEAAARASQRLPGAQQAASAPSAANGAHGPSTGRTGARKGHARAPLFRPGTGLRIAAATAGVAAVIGGAGYGLSILAGGGNSASSAYRPAFKSPPRPHGGMVTGLPAEPNISMPPRAGSGYPVVASHTDYQPGQLRSQAQSVLARFGTVRASPGAVTVPPSSPAFSPPGHLRACVARVSGQHTPELVDLASYHGQPAAVVFLPAAAGTQVLVAGAGCSASSADLLARTSLSATR
jgi:hypothetical protein